MSWFGTPPSAPAESLLLDQQGKMMAVNVAASPVLALLLVGLLASVSDMTRLLIGLAIVTAASAFTYVRLSRLDRENPVERTSIYLTANLCGGIAWGCMFWLSMPGNDTAQLYLAIGISFATAVNIVEAASVPRSFLGFHVPFSLLTMTAYAISGIGTARWAALMLGLIAAYSMVLAKAVYQQALDRAELVVRNAELIEDLSTLNQDLERQSSQDLLTGLSNRRALDRFMADALNQRGVSGAEVAALYIDLDRFKSVNDDLGHESGDQLLVQVAGRLLDFAPDHACVARYGGDEFVIAFTTDTGPLPAAIAETLVSSLTEPFHLRSGTVSIGASIGIAISSDHCVRERQLLRDADRALYAAKTAGGSRAVST